MNVISLCSLSPHPLSQEIFGSLGDDRINDLAKDISRRGLQYALEIDSENRVICGSQRHRALKILKWEKAPYVLRDDLDTEEKVREHLIRDNIMRRQLSPVQMFRAGKELERIYSIEAKERQKTGKKAERTAKAAQEVARDLGTSDMHFFRLKTVFESDDVTIQNAVEKGKLSVFAGAEAINKKRRKYQTSEMDDVRSHAIAFTRFKERIATFNRWSKDQMKKDFGPYQEDVKNVFHETGEALSCL